jgi:hypothetical protein
MRWPATRLSVKACRRGALAVALGVAIAGCSGAASPSSDSSGASGGPAQGPATPYSDQVEDPAAALAQQAQDAQALNDASQLRYQTELNAINNIR